MRHRLLIICRLTRLAILSLLLGALPGKLGARVDFVVAAVFDRVQGHLRSVVADMLGVELASGQLHDDLWVQNVLLLSNEVSILAFDGALMGRTEAKHAVDSCSVHASRL